MTAIIPATNRSEALTRCREAIEGPPERPEEVIVVEVPERSGRAEARNAGALPSTGDVPVFVDADVAVHSDAFARIRRHFVTDPGVAAAFGSYDDRPQVDGVVAHFRDLLHRHVHQSAGGAAHIFWAGLGAVRSDVFQAVGGFDAAEYHVASMEDIELGMRLADSGARIRLDTQLFERA